jgi:hypothetical protein
MATTELLLRCLEGTQNPALEIRAPAEHQLAQFSVQHGFGVALLEIFLSPHVGMQTRQLAGLLARRFICEHWNTDRPHFREPAVSDQHKAVMRAQLLQGLSDRDSKLCTAACMAVVSVAQDDLPSQWPELLEHLLNQLQAPTSQHVNAAMRCLVLLSEDINQQQVAYIIGRLFPVLLHVFTSTQQYSKTIRARACTVVYKGLKVGSLLLIAPDAGDGGAHAAAGASSTQYLSTSQYLQHALPSWIEVLSQALVAPMHDEGAAELAIRIEIVKIFSVLIQMQPQLVAPDRLLHLIHALWQGLAVAVEVYEQRVVLSRCGDTGHTADKSDVYDMLELDGDRVSPDALAWELMECVREVA